MTVPDWREVKAGARIRVALWLQAEVGAGGVFRKAQLRDAFPNIEQIDRRMRDLRSDGWVISTYREDASLAPDQLRLVRIGGAVWEKDYRSPTETSLPDKSRRDVLAAQNYSCAYCGVSAGETYAEDPLRMAKISIARTANQPADFIAVCDRCRVAPLDTPSEAEALSLVDSLDPVERARLKDWLRRGRRETTTAEKIWSMLRRLPYGSRDTVVDHIVGSQADRSVRS